jgi:cell fate (sporulation/competence/biofilm development) regulator YlbF (YheA/YmcA/DUF963 family)
MNETFLNKLYELKDAIKNDECIMRLEEVEKQMENDPEVMRLTYLKDVANEEYNQILRFHNDDDLEAVEARKKLAASKEELYSHPLVKEYLKLYQEVREIYEEMNKILFSGFQEKLCTKE